MPPPGQVSVLGGTTRQPPLERLWKNCIFELCGVTTFYRLMFTIVVTSTPEQRQEWLEKVRHIVREYFPLTNRGEQT